MSQNAYPLLISVAGTTLTRPANTTAYSVDDAVSDNATAGSVAPLTVTISDINGQPVAIERVRLSTTDTGPQTAGATFEMWMFRSDPTLNSGVSGGDNAAYNQKQAGFIGRLSGTFPGSGFSDGGVAVLTDRKSTRLNSSHVSESRMPSSA